MTNQNADGELDLDMFGYPVEPLRDRRGRPSFAKTPENQQFVENRVAGGFSHSSIAEALGCDEKTLRKHFSRELKTGRLRVEGEMLDVLRLKARQGHTPSIRLWFEIMKSSAPGLPASPARKPEVREEPKGKKLQRLDDAADPDAGYGDLYGRIQH